MTRFIVTCLLLFTLSTFALRDSLDDFLDMLDEDELFYDENENTNDEYELYNDIGSYTEYQQDGDEEYDEDEYEDNDEDNDEYEEDDNEEEEYEVNESNDNEDNDFEMYQDDDELELQQFSTAFDFSSQLNGNTPTHILDSAERMLTEIYVPAYGGLRPTY